MDRGRRRAEGRQQVDGSVGLSARLRLTLKRRATPPWIWCGVIFLAVLPACNSSQATAPSSEKVLRIGFPEGNVAAETGLGLGQLTSTLTLEGLTQTSSSFDGRPRPRLAEGWSLENDGRRL